MTSVKYNPQEIFKMAKNGDVGRWMAQIAAKVTIRTKYYLNNNMVNIRTGKLIHSVHTKSIQRTPPVWEVVADTYYAYWVHELYNRPYIAQAMVDVFAREGL